MARSKNPLTIPTINTNSTGGSTQLQEWLGSINTKPDYVPSGKPTQRSVHIFDPSGFSGTSGSTLQKSSVGSYFDNRQTAEPESTTNTGRRHTNSISDLLHSIDEAHESSKYTNDSRPKFQINKKDASMS
jgi:hypothetical protein